VPANHPFTGWCFDISRHGEDGPAPFCLSFFQPPDGLADHWSEAQSLWIEGMFHSVGVECCEEMEDCYGIYNNIDCRRVMFALADAGLFPMPLELPGEETWDSIFASGPGAEWARQVRESR